MRLKFNLRLVTHIVPASPLGSIAPTTGSRAGAFTHEDKLKDGEAPANRPYDFRFKLFTSATIGLFAGPIALARIVAALNRVTCAAVRPMFADAAIYTGQCASKNSICWSINQSGSTHMIALWTKSPEEFAQTTTVADARASLRSIQAPRKGTMPRDAGGAFRYAAASTDGRSRLDFTGPLSRNGVRT